MDAVLLTSAAFKLTFAFVAACMAWTLLRLLDRSLGVRFRSLHSELCKGNVAVAVYYGLRFIGAAILIGLSIGCMVIVAVLAAPAPASAQVFPDKYDADFKAASETWLPQWRWEYLKAQCFQESRLDPLAESPAGAVGLCQFMAPTAREEWAALKLGVVDRRQAAPSILAAAHYDAKLRRIWRSPRPESDRRDLTFASYNAGAGSILRAQRACGGAAAWPAIASCLHTITGQRNARETKTYVERINRWFGLLL